MKKLVIALAALSASSFAHADGFVCKTVEGDLTIKAYNNTQAEEGTRNAAVMVLSDPSIGFGKKTIARFTDLNETLTNVGASYEAKVDLRFNDSNLAGRNIGGTKLGFVKAVVLEVVFSYNTPVSQGSELEGTLTLVKRNGQELTHDVLCKRYLKN
jgi:long-subunit fatty acid transport protein